MKKMRFVFISTLAFMLMVLLGLDPAGAVVNGPAVGPLYVPGEALVKFKGAPAVAATTGPVEGPRLEQYLATLPPEAHTALQQVQATPVRAFPQIRVVQVKIPPQNLVPQAVADLQASSAVEYAEPNFIVRAQVIPNDSLFPSQWGLNNTGQTGGTANADINAPEAWTLQRNGTGAIVAVIDTGVDYNHPDLAANMWKNPREIKGNAIDDDKNGWVDDVFGINAFAGNGKPYDDNGHGTHVAGIIGAAGNNTAGVCGINWLSKIMALKFMNASGSGSIADAITCIKYALAIKARQGYPRMVMSNSWGSTSYSQALYDAINEARTAGVLFVVAAGNSGTNNDTIPFYPAGYALDNIISVGASDNKDAPASFSNYGFASVHLFAPGVSILSTYRANRYVSLSGTSMAAPHVSGTAALVWSKNPTLTWSGIKALILNGVDLKGTFFQKCQTGGRLNLQKPLVPALP